MQHADSCACGVWRRAPICQGCTTNAPTSALASACLDCLIAPDSPGEPFWSGAPSSSAFQKPLDLLHWEQSSVYNVRTSAERAGGICLGCVTNPEPKLCFECLKSTIPTQVPCHPDALRVKAAAAWQHRRPRQMSAHTVHVVCARSAAGGCTACISVTDKARRCDCLKCLSSLKEDAGPGEPHVASPPGACMCDLHNGARHHRSAARESGRRPAPEHAPHNDGAWRAGQRIPRPPPCLHRELELRRVPCALAACCGCFHLHQRRSLCRSLAHSLCAAPCTACINEVDYDACVVCYTNTGVSGAPAAADVWQAADDANPCPSSLRALALRAARRPRAPRRAVVSPGIVSFSGRKPATPSVTTAILSRLPPSYFPS